ncbi:MAG: hypothetical protein ABIO80_03970 [Sphingomicrobium sp.]
MSRTAYVRNGWKEDVAAKCHICDTQRVTGYHVVVLLIIVGAMASAARLFPRRPFVQFFAALGIALALGGLLVLGLYLYFLATGQA